MSARPLMGGPLWDSERVVQLLDLVLEQGVGRVSVEYVAQTPGPCWSADISVYRGTDEAMFGVGTGNNIIEALDDALTDLGESMA